MVNQKAKTKLRREAWSETKSAVRHYAANPCRATEIEVEGAMKHLREVDDLCAQQAPRSKQPKAPRT